MDFDISNPGRTPEEAGLALCEVFYDMISQCEELPGRELYVRLGEIPCELGPLNRSYVDSIRSIVRRCLIATNQAGEGNYYAQVISGPAYADKPGEGPGQHVDVYYMAVRKGEEG